MAVTIQLRRDSETNMNSVTPAVGEMLLATDTHKAVIGDGSGQDFQTMVTNNKFFKYEDGDGGRVFGGNDANETIIIKGNATQSVPIFKVTTSNTSNSIVEVYDDTQLVKIDATHGAVGDKTLLLKAKESQTGSVIEVQDSGSTDARFKVLEDGQTTIDPNDTTDPSLDVKGSSGSQSNGILRVQKSDGSTDLFKVDNGATILGSTPDHADPTSFGKIQTATTPNNTDSGAASDAVVDFPHFKAVTVGSGTAIRGKIELAGNSAAATFNALAVVKNGATPTTQAQIDYSGKGAFRDVEITQTGRNIADASVVRADELLGNVLKNIKDISATASITNSDASFPVGGFRPWVAGNTDNDNLPDEYINMSQLGVEGDSNVSMENAPAGKYFVFGIGLSNTTEDDHTFKSPQVTIVDHAESGNELLFRVNANRSAFGFVVRIT